ncbi:hypothetical protein [Noviherbaspirillum sp.]|uniref:hypothetical protein n=1 Tax=Noviherbaspirillum sp. TaxID=1926288 RepID=UPI002D40EBB6|nr:hypothetical protein [Noviherbaspirillum sp.]HZW21300.1 hypothetical protein [Noviherbaspirillum sp.]
MTGIVSSLYSAISSCWNTATVNDKDELTFDSPGRRDAAHGDKGERCVSAADCAAAQDEGRADIPEHVAEKDRGMWRSAMHKIFSETGAGTLNLQAYREGIRELHPDTRKLLRERVKELMAERSALNTFRARELLWEIEKVDIEMVEATEIQENRRAIEVKRNAFYAETYPYDIRPVADTPAASKSTALPVRDRTACMTNPRAPLAQPKGDEPGAEPTEFFNPPALEEPTQHAAIATPSFTGFDELTAQNLEWRINADDMFRRTAVKRFYILTRLLAHGMAHMNANTLLGLKTERNYQILSDAAAWYSKSGNKTLEQALDLNMLLISQLCAPLSRIEQYLAATDGGKNIDTNQLLISPDREVEQDEIEGTTGHWNKIFDGRPAMESALAMHCDLRNPAAVANVKNKFREFLAMAAASGEGKLTLAILNLPNHWMGLLATVIDGKPAFYICDTNGSNHDDVMQAIGNSYINTLRLFSNGNINHANTTYCGYSMQVHARNACGPLACWMIEEAIERSKTSKRPIDDLLGECHQAWLNDIAGREWEEAFIRLLRARMLARMGQ